MAMADHWALDCHNSGWVWVCYSRTNSDPSSHRYTRVHSHSNPNCYCCPNPYSRTYIYADAYPNSGSDCNS